MALAVPEKLQAYQEQKVTIKDLAISNQIQTIKDYHNPRKLHYSKQNSIPHILWDFLLRDKKITTFSDDYFWSMPR